MLCLVLAGRSEVRVSDRALSAALKGIQCLAEGHFSMADVQGAAERWPF